MSKKKEFMATLEYKLNWCVKNDLMDHDQANYILHSNKSVQQAWLLTELTKKEVDYDRKN